MASLLEQLQDLIFALFVRDPETLERRRGLRTLYAKLCRTNPSYFRRSTGQLLPEFAETIERLAAVLKPLRELFDKTLASEDPRLSARYADAMLLSRLPAKLQEAYGALSFSSLKQRVLGAPQPDKELELVEAEVQELVGRLSDPDLRSFEAEHASTQQLASLSRHDLSPLLAAFRAAPAEGRSGFSAAAGAEALQQLLDLYFVLSGLELSAGVQRNAASLLERLTRIGPPEAEERLRGIFSRLHALLDDRLNAPTLLALVRLIQKDPTYVPQAMREEPPGLESFRNRWLVSFQRSRDRVRCLLRENEVAEDLKTLFGEVDLLEIEGYEEAVDQALQRHDLEGFTRFRPLRILKSYALMHFEQQLREPLKRLIVEGKFINKIFQNMLTDTFFRCEGIAERIREFEQLLRADGAKSARRLPRYLELLEQGKPASGMVSAVLEAVESASGKLVDEGSQLFYNLGVILLEVLNDARLKMPKEISNIKEIGGRKSQELLGKLSAGYGSLLVFNRIMKNFGGGR